MNIQYCICIIRPYFEIHQQEYIRIKHFSVMIKNTVIFFAIKSLCTDL